MLTSYSGNFWILSKSTIKYDKLDISKVTDTLKGKSCVELSPFKIEVLVCKFKFLSSGLPSAAFAHPSGSECEWSFFLTNKAVYSLDMILELCIQR